MVVAKTNSDLYVILGAPRAEHKGLVILSSPQDGSNYTLDSPEVIILIFHFNEEAKGGRVAYWLALLSLIDVPKSVL